MPKASDPFVRVPVRLLQRLSHAELLLWCYVRRHQADWGNDEVRLSDDEVLRGRRRRGGGRLDEGAGAGLKSRNTLVRARQDLIAKGLLSSDLDDEDGARVVRFYSIPASALTPSAADPPPSAADPVAADPVPVSGEPPRGQPVTPSPSAADTRTHRRSSGRSSDRSPTRTLWGEDVDPPSQPKGDHQKFIDLFTDLYRSANDGAKPTWRGRRAKRAKELLTAHGVAELERRARIYWSPACPKWLQDGRDFDSFDKHIDKLATPSNGNGAAGRAVGYAPASTNGDFTSGEKEIG